MAFSQKIKASEVPQGILKAYQMKVIDTLTTNWEKIGSYYTAHFTKSNLKASMVFQESSEWIWTRWEIATQYLPKKVKEYITANYPKYKIASAIIEYKPGGEFYLVGLKLKKEMPVLRFNIKSEFVAIEPAKTSSTQDSKAPNNTSKEK
jgi:hypothetical protein